MTLVTRLHPGNSAVYRPRGQPKRATIRWLPAEYELEWGHQKFDGPHVVVADDGESEYGVDLQVFFATHQACADERNTYVKTAKVRALQVTDTTEIETRIRDRVEGGANVQPGGWIVQNPDGELYYNTAEEFARRYEPEPSGTSPARPETPTLNDHLFGGGAKRILALDGGGIRGRISLGILKQIEARVGSPLSNYFDLIGGTSTGSIIAVGLALGWGVDKLINLYDDLGSEVFEGSLFRRGLWRAKFPTAPLERALKAHFKDTRLGGPELETGLVIVTKRADTNSPWPIHNNPRGPYYGDPPAGRNWIPNKNHLLRQLIRASSAAPCYFDPVPISVALGEDGVFVDGGVSPHNNPSLQLVLMAALQGYGFGWPLGADRLSVVSVGTGTWSVKHPAQQLLEKSAVEKAVLSLLSVMDDCSALNELLMLWLSDSKTPRTIDSEVGDLAGEFFGGEGPFLSYVRYNANLELDWLKKRLPEEDFNEDRLKALREMDNPRSLELLAKIGDAAGEDVREEHFEGGAS